MTARLQGDEPCTAETRREIALTAYQLLSWATLENGSNSNLTRWLYSPAAGSSCLLIICKPPATACVVNRYHARLPIQNAPHSFRSQMCYRARICPWMLLLMGVSL